MFRLIPLRNPYVTTREPLSNVKRNWPSNRVRWEGPSALRGIQQACPTAATASVTSEKPRRGSVGGNVPKKQWSKNGFQRQKLDPTSPWFHQLNAYDECVVSTLQESRTPLRKDLGQRIPKAGRGTSDPLFWDAVRRAVGIYEELKETGALDPTRVGYLIHLLHNGLRANRSQLVDLNRKPDYDSSSFHKESLNFLYNSLKTIANDIAQSQYIKVDEYGLMHLLTSFKEMDCPEEAVQLWHKGYLRESERNVDPSNIRGNTKEMVFTRPMPVGAILPLLFEQQVMNFSELVQLYQTCKEKIPFIHGGLITGMIDTCLKAEQNEMAFELFSELCSDGDFKKYGYIIKTHLAFIGNCKDLGVAQNFYDKAVDELMPYKFDLEVSVVKSFLDNIWNQVSHQVSPEAAYEKVEQVWLRSLQYYANNVNRGVVSSLNSTFFSIFFSRFQNDKLQGVAHLSEVISQFNNVKGVDEPFLNIIASKCIVWHDREIIEYLSGSYELFKVPKTVVTLRILLRSLGFINDVTPQEILESWEKLILKIDSQGSSYIANADWAALREATVTWYKNAQFNSELLNSMDPAMIKQRLDIYLQIVKKYMKYCRDSYQVNRITKGLAELSELEAEFQRLDTINADAIMVPQLNCLKEFK